MLLYQKLSIENQDASSEKLSLIENCVEKALESVREEFPENEITSVNDMGFLQGDFEEQPMDEQERFEILFREELENEDLI